jgi:lipopolysaccharide/colanic/teichoic acid biosynthesis glycosyltransferase
MAEVETATHTPYEAVVASASPQGLSRSDRSYAMRARIAAAEREYASSVRSYRRFGKRLIDVSLSCVLMLLLAPVILGAALLVALLSGWPPFYSARRVGKDGREFSMWKIRTMVRDADRVMSLWQNTRSPLAKEYASNYKLVRDPRITRLGGFLRRTSIDELPQLWNVLRGDMSLVGPRPYYRSELEAHPSTRFAVAGVRPGLTGPWQVQGRNVLGPQVRMQLDEWYAERYTLRLDVMFLVKTVRVLLRADGI